MDRQKPKSAEAKAAAKARQLAASRALLGLFSALMLAVIGTSVLVALASPFYMIESALYLLFIFSPATVLVFVQMEGFIARQQEKLSAIGKKPVWPHLTALLVGLILAFMTIDVGLLTNWLADGSEGEPQRAVVESKFVSYGKGHRTYYNVRIHPPTEPPLPFTLSDIKTLQLRKADFTRVIEGESEVELVVHKGALGLPWYERGHNAVRVVGHVLPDAVPSAKELLSQTTVTDGLMREACLWKKNFNLDREIPPRVPTGYHRDFWPNGAPRSVEPQVNGRNHGVAHYTFAHGGVYADIPWKDGKKHGVFTLYREDGTKEQELSYFQGQMFGIQQWFDQAGRLSVEYVYIDDATPLAASRCDGVVK